MKLSSQEVRLTARQRESAERRIRMTRRRQELTSRIRKEKKSLYLQSKRSFGTSLSVKGISHTSSSLKSLLRSYCQSLTSTSPEQFLLTLESFIAASASASTTIDTTTTITTTNKSVYVKNGNYVLLLEQDDENLALKFLDCLRQQTIEAFANHNICDVSYNELSFQSALKILVHFTFSDDASSMLSSSSSSGYYGRLPLTWPELLINLPSNSTTLPSWLEILVQTLSSSKEVELICIVLGNLMTSYVLRSVSVHLKESIVSSLVRSVSTATPTAAWTLTNMIRNDLSSYAGTYCSDTLLSTSQLSMWLLEPSIATQTAWMIASLTAREEQAVQYLCQRRQRQEFSFLSTLVMSLQNPLQQDQTVALIQALGNLACHASLITPLLTQTIPPLIPLLQKLLSTTSSRDPLLVQGVWLAGCLLVDVGIENHPSTMVAAPALIPVLMERLGGEITITLEEEREFASALWNAFDAPPIINAVDGQQQVQQSSQNAFLITHPSQSSPVHLPFNLDVPRSTLQTLVRLVNSNDCDAVLASVHVADLLLRREGHYGTSFHPHQNLQTIMQDEELPDALERVCGSSMEEAADTAADLIDDYFTDEQNNNEGNDMWSPQDQVETNSFPWNDGFPASSVMFPSEIGSPRLVNGVGRGRGATIPAWMEK
mmetsp:Transcript_46640/g.52975  ORF Transcript_46640/g.52975 Transcript_46640/m.52975 type:complete len:658 (+) Transcript_46640:65-2038(+)